MFYAINKHSNFCCLKALAYTNLDRQCAVFLYIIFAVLIKCKVLGSCGNQGKVPVSGLSGEFGST